MELTLFNSYTEEVITVVIEQLQDLNPIILDKFQIPFEKQIIKFGTKHIDPYKTFEFYNLNNNDLLVIEEGWNEDYMERAQDAMISESLLYIKAKINHFSFKAMIDTGAQTNVMSIAMARTLKIDHLIDHTFVGMAKGVGSAKILGAIFNLPLNINGIIIRTKFKVMDTEDKVNADLVLLGLEFILSKCGGINFRRRMITIQEKNVYFLNEKEIKEFEQPINERESQIEKLLTNLNDHLGKEQAIKSLELIQKIISNIINYPEDDIKKRVNINAKSVKDNIIGYVDCVKIMEYIGFEFSDSHIEFKRKDIKNLEEASKMLIII
jgi:hypothetical protein